jgi:glyoxylase-like metal-dependent hydrolase (beta-lactamase superfamily II)
MKRLVLLVALVAVLIVHGTWVVLTQGPARGARLQRVTGDLHLLSGEGGNVAVYVTAEGVVLVDDMYDRNAAEILAQVKGLTDRPLRYVFNTHQHDDHAGGNAKLLPLADIIAHRNARANLVAKKPPFFEETPGTPIGLPRVTFSDEASVFVGGKEVRAYHFGRGHTNGDAIIYFPDEKVIHTGDLFLAARAPQGRGAAPVANRPVGVSMYVDYSQGGSFLEWTQTLDRALALDFQQVIPGHGPVATRADLAKYRADLETMRNRVAGLIREGRTRDEMVRVMEADYGWRATGCPPSPLRSGCLQYQQIDAMLEELR